MIQNRSCVNGIVAAVLSASILPIHGALAKEKTPAAHKTAARKMEYPPARKVDRQEAPREEGARDLRAKDAGAKPDVNAGAPATQ